MPFEAKFAERAFQEVRWIGVSVRVGSVPATHDRAALFHATSMLRSTLEMPEAPDSFSSKLAHDVYGTWLEPA